MKKKYFIVDRHFAASPHPSLGIGMSFSTQGMCHVISVLSSFDWQGYLKGIAAKVIPQHQVYAVLAAAIPEII